MTSDRRWSLPFALRALRYPKYRALLCGQAISLLGTWMTTTTTSWLVFRLTGSPMALGAVAFATQMPAFVLAPFAGYLADRLDRRRLLLCTQAGLMLGVLLLAALTLTERVTVAQILGISLMQGVVSAIDMPTRTALTLSTIERREDIANGVALNAMVTNGTRMVGAAAAGAIIVGAGEGWCYLVDGISYLVPIAILARIRVEQQPAADGSQSRRFRQVVDGWRTVMRLRPVRSIATLLLLVTFCGIPYALLMPILVADGLQGGAQVLGLMFTASATGAVLGCIILARWRGVAQLPRVAAGGAFVYGCGMIAFSLSQHVWLSLLITALSGCSSMLHLGSGNTLLQTLAPPEFRGRVMSVFFMTTIGVAPLGSLLAGAVSTRVGAASTLRVGGLCCIAAAAWFATTQTARILAALPDGASAPSAPVAPAVAPAARA